MPAKYQYGKEKHWFCIQCNQPRHFIEMEVIEGDTLLGVCMYCSDINKRRDNVK